MTRILSASLKNVSSVGLILLACASLFSACDKTHLSGHLTVRYLEGGEYEIYKIAREQPLQFISETRSHFNERTNLSPGSYMVLADCSSEIVNIYPGSDVTLVAHRVNFVPMQPPSEQDKFPIQCVRSDRTHSRQNLMNHFSLTMLAGTRELLVGMIPLRLDLTAKEPKNIESKVISYVLSFVSVSTSAAAPNDNFFLSPVGGVTPYTESQKPGAKLYVLHGKYDLQLNGTEVTVDLAEGESRTVIAGTVTVTTSPNADMARAEKILGAPIYAEINGEHYMNLNTTYPVLPGPLSVRLATSLRPQSFEVGEGEHLKIHARNVSVDLGCAENDWACLGSKKVRLFEKDKNYHFAESQTDVPILYLEDHISLGVEGSRNIKHTLTSGDDQKIKMGFLEVKPTPSHKPGVLTDLMRVEPLSPGITGTSLDMILDKPTTMPLMAGQYHLSQYTFFSTDGSRRKTTQRIFIAPGQVVKVDVQTFLSEKRMANINQNTDESSKQ